MNTRLSVRMPLLAAMALLEIFAVSAAAQAGPNGYWAAFVDVGAKVCADGAHAWAWSEPAMTDGAPHAKGVADRETLLRLLGADGTTTTPRLTLNARIGSLYPTNDCSVVWAVDFDGRRVWRIDRNGSIRNLKSELPPEGAIKSVRPLENGEAAWIQFDDSNPVAFATVDGDAVVLRSTPGIEQTRDENDIQETSRGGLWIVPGDSDHPHGLWIADASGVSRIRELDAVNILKVHASNAGRVAWTMRQEKGVDAVTADGRLLSWMGSTTLLPNVDVQTIAVGPDATSARSGEYAWLVGKNHDLYAFHVVVDAGGPVSLQAVNGLHAIATRSDGEALHAVSIAYTGNGSTIWVAGGLTADSQQWDTVWRVTASADGSVHTDVLDPALYEHRHVVNFYPDMASASRLVLRTIDGYFYAIDAATHTSRALGSPAFTNVVATNVPARFWVTTTRGTYLMGPASDLQDVHVAVAGVQFGATSSVTLAGQLENARVAVRFQRPVDLPFPHGRVEFVVTPADTATAARRVAAIAAGDGETNDRAEASFPLFVRDRLTPLQPYTIELSYSDQRTFDLKMAWSARFRPPWYEYPFVQAGALLLAPIVLVCMSIAPSSRLRRWVPLLVPGAEMVMSRSVSISWLAVEPRDFVIVAIGAFSVVAAAAIWSPRLLRSISSIEPYRSLIPFVFELPGVRRRAFSEYLADLRLRMERARRDANNEVYVSIPCSITDAASGLASPGDLTSVDQLANWLTTTEPSQRANILIEAPGGRGKSALIHELIHRAIRAFEADPRCPLPVISDGRGENAEDLVINGLGRHLISRDFAISQMRAGQVGLFLDGVSDSSADTAVLDRLFGSNEFGANIRLCAASRPSRNWRTAFERADCWAVVSPQRLTSATVGEFLRLYAADVPETAMHRRISVARSADGTYLPLLVRFAMLANEEEIHSVGDLYAFAFAHLTEHSSISSKDLLAAAERLALSTYWLARERVFDFQRPTAEETESVQHLFAAGVLIESGGSPSAIAKQPRRVRFVHDSMQSYFAARALFAAGDWSVLLKAGGDPQFVNATSDMFPGPGSELLHMCIYVFKPLGELRRWLQVELRRIGENYSHWLSVKNVHDALPPQLQSLADATVAPDTAPGHYLKVCLDLVPDNHEGAVEALGRLYGALAPVVLEATNTTGTVSAGN